VLRAGLAVDVQSGKAFNGAFQRMRAFTLSIALVEQMTLRISTSKLTGRIVLVIADVVSDLARQRGLQEPLGQPLQQAALTGQLEPVVPGTVTRMATSCSSVTTPTGPAAGPCSTIGSVVILASPLIEIRRYFFTVPDVGGNGFSSSNE
jgi:hypothetical protein